MQAVGSQVLFVLLFPLLFLGYVLYHFRQPIINTYNIFFQGPQQRPVAGARPPAFGRGQCAICLNQPKRLQVSATCGHSYCGTCIIEIYRRAEDKISCPLCRKAITTLFRVFPDGIEDPNSETVIVAIMDYNWAYQDNRPWQRRIMQFPHVWRMVRRGLLNPRFLLFFVRSLFFLRFVLIVLIYIIIPFDLIPEQVFGFAGFIDDVLIIFVVLIFMITIAAVAYIRLRAV